MAKVRSRVRQSKPTYAKNQICRAEHCPCKPDTWVEANVSSYQFISKHRPNGFVELVTNSAWIERQKREGQEIRFKEEQEKNRIRALALAGFNLFPVSSQMERKMLDQAGHCLTSKV